MTIDRIPFLKGKLVHLCVPRKEDMAHIVQWFNDPSILQFLASREPATLEAEMEWYDRVTKSQPHQRDFVFFLETKADKQLIGTMGLHGINYRTQVGSTGAAIGHHAAHGKGYGTDAKMQLLHWAFTELNLRKVVSNVLSANPRSLRYLEKTGYKVVGTRKKHSLFQGSFVDEHILEVFKEDFMPLWDAYQST